MSSLRVRDSIRLARSQSLVVERLVLLIAIACSPMAEAGQEGSRADLKRAIEGGMDNLIAWARPMTNVPAEKAVNHGHPALAHWHIRHNVGRAIDALLRGNEAIAKPIPEEIEAALRRYLFASLDNPTHFNAAFSAEEGRLVFHAHDVREAILALTALVHYRNDDQARRDLDNLLDALGRLVREDGTFDPEVVAGMPLLEGGHFTEHRTEPNGKVYNLACWTRGRWIMALCRCYRQTGDKRALDLAARLVGLVKRVSFTSDGKISRDEFFHTHSITGTVHGLIDYGLTVGDSELVMFARRVFDEGLPEVSSSYGWSVETAWRDPERPERGEVNNTGDMIQAALLLGQNGMPQYFQDAERRIRSHVLPSQCADSGWGFPSPNDRALYGESILDITAGAVQALCEVSGNLATQEDARLNINLLFDNWAGPARVESELPERGHLKIVVVDEKEIFVRVSPWVDRQKVQLTVGGVERKPVFKDLWLVVGQARSGEEVIVNFPLPESEENEVVNKRPYQLVWRGDQVVALSPKGSNQPMFPSVEEYLAGK